MNLINIDFNKSFYFYRLPKFLFKAPYNKLSANAKLAYSLLFSRLTLSIKNNYIDEDRNVFIYYTREELCNDLNIGKVTAIKTFKELLSANLIKEVKHNNTFRIYLYDVFKDEYKVQKINHDSSFSETSMVQNVYPNKNNKSYNNNSKNGYLNYEQRNYSDMPEEWWRQFYSNI